MPRICTCTAPFLPKGAKRYVWPRERRHLRWTVESVSSDKHSAMKDRMLREAFAEAETIDIPDGNFSFEYVSALRPHDILIQYRYKPKASWLGWANFPSTNIKPLKITFNTAKLGIRYNLFYRRTALHEIMHNLGLEHNPTNWPPDRLMNTFQIVPFLGLEIDETARADALRLYR